MKVHRKSQVVHVKMSLTPKEKGKHQGKYGNESKRDIRSIFGKEGDELLRLFVGIFWLSLRGRDRNKVLIGNVFLINLANQESKKNQCGHPEQFYGMNIPVNFACSKFGG